MNSLNSEKEEWRQVVGYEGLYMVSNLGRFKSLDKIISGMYGDKLLKGRMLGLFEKSDGYISVGVRKNSISKRVTIHRLVAMAFLDFDPTKQVNHINGIKSDNRASNLEMVTCAENMRHRYNVLGQKNPFSGKKGNVYVARRVEQIDRLTDAIIMTHFSCTDAARFLGYDENKGRNISNCATGRAKTFSGFKWRYVEKELGKNGGNRTL